MARHLTCPDACKNTSVAGFQVDNSHYAPQTRPGRYTILEHLNLEASAIQDAVADYTKAISN